jgi:K+-sensing histidine kinase KdpD
MRTGARSRPAHAASERRREDEDEMKTAMHHELSHGLRTPLTSVLGFAATLLDQWDELDDEQRTLFLQTLYGEALRMAHSIEQVDRQLYHQFAA